MIIGSAALFLNYLAITVFALPLVALILLAVASRLPRLGRIAADQRRRLLWLITLSPWLLALVSTLLAILPFYNGELARSVSFMIWHHSTDFPLFSWHSLTVFLLLLYLAFRMAPGLRQMRQQQVDLKALHAFAQALDKNTFLLPGKQANAFTAGLLRPRCYLTTGLRDALSNEELEIVLQHERVHARHHDPLLKWLFALASSVYPQLVATQLQQQMTLAMEQHADEAVASKRFGKSDVALTLVKVQRLAAAGLQRANEQFCYFTGDALEQRVHYLMQREMVTGFPLRAVLFLAPLAFLLSSAFTDSLHHAIELLLSF